MKKVVFYSILAIASYFSSLSSGQEFVGGLLGNQEGTATKGTQPANQGGVIRSVIREQIQNAIQPNLPGAQNTPSNVQGQGSAQLNGQIGGSLIQNGAQLGVNTSPTLHNPQGAGTSIGSQLLGVLRANLVDHAAIGQDGTVRFKNDVNPQLRGMGILPNDQLVDSSGQVIRDFNTANSLLHANQNVRVNRNGQIITIQQMTSHTNLNVNQFGWAFGTRNNGVFISSLASNGIAANAGLRAGDQIVSVNGNAVARPEDISFYMVQANNSTMAIGYVRNGQSGETSFNAPIQDISPRLAPQSIQSKLDQIERLIGEIRAEFSSTR